MIEFNTPALKRYRMWRYTKDRLAGISIGIGGTAVLGAILTIFLYLMYEVIPLFNSAEVESDHAPFSLQMTQPQPSDPIYLAMEEQAEIALRLDTNGNIIFFNTDNGKLIKQESLPLSASLSSFALLSEESAKFAVAQSNGKALIAKHKYRVTYPDDKRLISPYMEYPYGDEGLVLSESSNKITDLAYSEGDSSLVFAGVEAGKGLGIWVFTKEEDFLTEEVVLERNYTAVPPFSGTPKKILIDSSQKWMFILTDENRIHVFDIAEAAEGSVTLVDTADFSSNPVADVTSLLGGISILISHDNGDIDQWFMARNEDRNWYFAKVREFESDVKAMDVMPEQRRKGFLALSHDGVLAIFHSTSHRELLTEKVTDLQPVVVALSPRADKILIEGKDGKIQAIGVDNEHPEVSWSALWQKVWYESYDEPEYIWQSSASNNDFEPKYSLMPLSFGTLKAAFYAMLLGAPLAICGAIYTAYFMSPKLRGKIKPLIELMEALPTVILGFLAGLWLAPFLETNLSSVFTLLIFLPIGVLLASFIYTKLPPQVRFAVPEGWEGALLIPVVLFIGWACIASNGVVEHTLFGGDMRAWVTNDLGISFDQRNALVVGIAMGFAVIPTIFSITEDAIFSVPKHLSNGSLALGATRWQTLVGVVLPTASPGIFSALMIGLGRAVGETMIVLMATGNTPIMDINIFEGMRTLAANIAVEVPEAEVDSSHYRVLFLAALVLFSFTFIVNTMAELIRQRLRVKFGQL